jgi:hypothetical protein
MALLLSCGARLAALAAVVLDRQVVVRCDSALAVTAAKT